MHNPSSATTNDAFTFPIRPPTAATRCRRGTLRINGQDAKTLVADYDMEGQHLVYSTSEIMTHVAQGVRLALLHGRDGEDGETVLRYGSQPTVDACSPATSHRSYDAGDRRPAAELPAQRPGRGADQRRRPSVR